jgi:Tfp pilus assembly protein PilF
MNIKGCLSVVVFLGLAVTAVAGDSKKSAQGEADIAHNNGNTYLQQGRADLAAAEFKKALKADPKHFLACKGLGLALDQLKDYKEAEKTQRKCIEDTPDFADLHNDLAATLILLGKRDEARKEWLLAFNSPFNPSPDQTASNVGRSYFEDGNYDEAGRWFQIALQKDPKSVMGQTGMASTLIAQNHLDLAIKGLEDAIGKGKNASKEPDLLLALCTAYYKAGRFPEARTQCEAVQNLPMAGAASKGEAGELLKHFPK